MNTSKAIQTSLSLILGLFTATTAFGQAGLQDMSFTAATTTRDAGGRPWAYLVWDATTPGLLRGRQFAIYKKAGVAASPALYERVAIVQRHADSRVIAALLNRAMNLGENTNDLNDSITELFQTLTSAMTLPLPEKISAVIRGSTGNAAFETNLRLLARVHPAMAMSLGLGHAELISSPDGTNTFEIREFDAGQSRDLGVVGRVTVAAGRPVVLPAPDAPVLVQESNPKGHLNVKFRWASSPELRRLSLLQYGFNVWRMTKSFAEARGYPNNPSALTNLPGLASEFRDDIRMINHMPVLPGKSFDAVSVRDFISDPSTRFVTDDNDRFDGSAPFNDGDRYYYFVTARDLLGRDGMASRGTLVTLCNRLPPSPPKGLRVENDYTYTNSSDVQCFKLSWRPNTNSAEDRANAYFVYRWTSQTQMLAFDAARDYLAHAIAGPIPHMGGVTQLCVLDNGAGAPSISRDGSQADDDQTFWYTVRAVETNACGTNFSPNSTFVYGVLRDRVGPPKPTGYVELNCPSPTIAFGDSTGVGEAGQDPQRAYFRVEASRRNVFLQWAEFSVRVRKRALIQQNPPVVGPIEEVLQLGRVEFDESNVARFEFDLPRTNLISVAMTARSVLANGVVSPPLESTARTPREPGTRLLVWFNADVVITSSSVRTPTAVRITTINLLTNNGVRLFFVPRISGDYRVLASSDLVQWTEVPPNGVFRTVGSVTFQDPARATQRHRFYRLIPGDSSAPAPCAHLTMFNPVSGTNPGVKTVIDLPPTSKEFRLYRRVDDGPLTLIAQGRGDAELNLAVTNRDQALPAGSVSLCYFAQVLDRHGNPSPMTQLGSCFTSIQSRPPCPLVSAIERAGTNGDEKALVKWFCPTSGVDRFEIRLAPRTPPTNSAIGGGTSGGARTSRGTRALASGVLQVVFATNYTTERIGGALGAGPKFSLEVGVKPGEQYTIEVVALSKAGIPSDGCRKARSFEWTGPPAVPPPPGSVTPPVPWPARGLPPVVNWPEVQAMLMGQTNGAPGYDASYPVGIRIGRIDFAVSNYICSRLALRADPNAAGQWEDIAPASPSLGIATNQLPIREDPSNYLFPVSAFSKTEKLFPVALYRTQVTNAAFPAVSGDVVQASPLMERIAYNLSPFAPGFTDVVRLQDSFVRAVSFFAYRYSVRPETTPPGACPPQYFASGLLIEAYAIELYLLDTQPVLAGGTYRYLLVRFHPITNEPVQVIDAGVVSIPAN